MPADIQIIVSASRAGSGTGEPYDTTLQSFRAGTFLIDVTAATGTLSALETWVQTELPNGSWGDLFAFDQVSIDQVPIKRIAVITFPSGGAQAMETTVKDASLAKSTIGGIPLGRKYRVKWRITGTSSPSFTFAVWADLFGWLG